MTTKHYRDYGALNGSSAPQAEIEKDTRTQVYKVTHDGEGKRLPFMNRSFISFSYGEDQNGRPVYIEDFNLIVTNTGDRMEKNLYANFSDLTSSYDTIPGQFYWGTYFHENSLTFNLTTDEMTQDELDKFKYWFRAGSIRELILSEHPNRAIMARIATPPAMSMIPFEKKIEITLGRGEDSDSSPTYTTSTTVYRGDITLEFVMDEPFWYAKQNILGVQDAFGQYIEEQWVDANGVQASIADSPDALKIIYEDHIPIGSTIKLSVFLGGDLYAKLEYEAAYAKIEAPSNSTQYEAALALSDDATNLRNKLSYYYYYEEQDENGQVINILGPYDAYNTPEAELIEEQKIYAKGGRIAADDNDKTHAVIAGAQVSSTSDKASGVSLPPGENAYLYYAGTAPSPVKVSFKLRPEFTNFYITTPKNKLSNAEVPYNTLTLEATNKHEFRFTLPTFWNSYNQVLKIFENKSIMRAGNAWLTVRETIRDTIRHPIVRAWANRVIDEYDTASGSGIIQWDEASIEPIIGAMKQKMQKLLLDPTDGLTPYYASFTFDGRTGEAIGEFSYTNEENSTSTSVENVGDMVKSSYLILDERNVLDDQFRVQEWTEQTPNYSYKISHDLSQGVENGLEELHFEFKNMYL